MDRMRAGARGSGRVRDCVCVGVGARLSVWKVMDGWGGGGGGGERGRSRGESQNYIRPMLMLYKWVAYSAQMNK